MVKSAEIASPKIALFIGAHPDDVEIGAGASVAWLTSHEWEVWIIVLTSEANEEVAQTRKTEARKAAGILNVNTDHVLFADLPDTELTCNGASVEHVRHILREWKIDPDVVFTHTHADSHKDHREANQITTSVFRKRPILGFGVVNSLTKPGSHGNSFQPRLFLNVSDTHEVRIRALYEYSSQRERIDAERISVLCTDYGRSIGARYAEAFDLLIQEGTSPERVALALDLNHSSFHRFWSTVIGSRELVIVHAAPVYRAKRDGRWQSDKDREGISLVYRSFNDLWEGRVPVDDLSCKAVGVEAYLESYDILLSGGAVSNSITREYFNHFKGVRYIIDYTMPDYADIRIRDKVEEESIRAVYEPHERLRTRNIVRDVGILTVMPNPLSSGRSLIGCMGIHGYGSLACFRYLSDPILMRELGEFIRLPLSNTGFQLLVQYDVQSERPSVIAGSLHIFEC